MSNTATPGEQPAATTVPDAGAQPQPGAITEAALDGLTDEQALALIDGRTLAQAPEPESTPEPEKVIEGEKPQPDPKPDTEPEPKAKHAQRIRLTGLQEADQQKVTDALNLVREGKASDIATAMKMVAGEEAAPVQASQAAPDPQPDTEPTVLENLQSELEAAQAELAAAEDDYADSSVKGPIHERINRLNREIAKEEIKAELAAERQQSGIKSYNDQYGEAVAEVEQQYAHVFDTNPDFEDLLDAYKAKAEADNDPIIQDPRYVIGLAEKAARVLGLSKTPAATMAPAPPVRAAKPVGSTTAPGHTHRAVPTKDQVLASIDSLSIEELAALVDRK